MFSSDLRCASNDLRCTSANGLDPIDVHDLDIDLENVPRSRASFVGVAGSPWTSFFCAKTKPFPSLMCVYVSHVHVHVSHIQVYVSHIHVYVSCVWLMTELIWNYKIMKRLIWQPAPEKIAWPEVAIRWIMYVYNALLHYSHLVTDVGIYRARETRFTQFIILLHLLKSALTYWKKSALKNIKGRVRQMKYTSSFTFGETQEVSQTVKVDNLVTVPLVTFNARPFNAPPSLFSEAIENEIWQSMSI